MAHPSTGFAQACIMYLNYFEYYKRSIESVQLDAYKFPSKWNVYLPSETPPSWVQAASESCTMLEAEISKAYKLVEAIRTMVSQHAGLLAPLSLEGAALYTQRRSTTTVLRFFTLSSIFCLSCDLARKCHLRCFVPGLKLPCRSSVNDRRRFYRKF